MKHDGRLMFLKHVTVNNDNKITTGGEIMIRHRMPLVAVHMMSGLHLALPTSSRVPCAQGIRTQQVYVPPRRARLPSCTSRIICTYLSQQWVSPDFCLQVDQYFFTAPNNRALPFVHDCPGIIQR